MTEQSNDGQELRFHPCRIHLTVGSIVDRQLSPSKESRLVKALGQDLGEEHADGQWHVGRPNCRWGVHPDILLRTGLTGSQESGTAQEFFLRERITPDGSPGGVLSTFAAAEAQTGTTSQVDVLRKTIWPKRLSKEALADYPLVSNCTVLCRVLPSGVATCTVSVECKTSESAPATDVQIDNLLKCLDPRRRPEPRQSILGSEPPDLTKILAGGIAALGHQVWDITQEKQLDRDGGSTKHTAVLKDLGIDLRARTEWLPGTLPDWCRVEVEQLPYCTIDVGIGKSSFWEDGTAADTAHRRMFHLMAGTYLGLTSRTLEVPRRLRDQPDQQRMRSLTWSRDSFALATARGAGLAFMSGNGEWFRDLQMAESYRRSAICAIEEIVGTWVALGLLNVWVDKAIHELGEEPARNIDQLDDLSTARRILARLLGEPIFYQAEGSSVRSIAELARSELGIAELRDSLLKKLSEVRDLHDLLLHLAALRQIQSEQVK